MRWCWRSFVFVLVTLCSLPRPSKAEAGEGTWVEPYSVDDFPYVHEWDTTTGVEMVDRYDCADGLDESGPEVVYRFEVIRPGRVTAWVEGDVPGSIDVDVHLVESPDVTGGRVDCLDRGHQVAEADFSPGPGWVSVDTFVDEGEPLPGPYVLRIDFSPEEEGVIVRERQVALGVLWRQEIHADLFGGVQSVNLLEVDLTHPEVVIEPRLGDGCERTSSISRRVEAVAGINAGFFGAGCEPVGLVRIEDRYLASNPSSRPPRATLGLGDDGLALVEHIPPGDPFDEVHHALGGLPQLVRHGVPDVTWREEGAGESFSYSRHPRTAACVTGDDYLLFITFDGRTDAGLGVDLFDLADFMVSLGCERGLNYDGGGSSTMWVWPWVGSGVVSYPSDNRTANHLGERAVSNGWMIWAPRANRPPRFTNVPPLEAWEEVVYTYDADAIDLDLESVVFSLESAPDGMVVDRASGVVTWTPTYRDERLQEVIVAASDMIETTELNFEITLTIEDRDGDGLPDRWETEYGTDPERDDALDDPDGDGLTNIEEFDRGSDPNAPPEADTGIDSGTDGGGADGDADADVDADSDGDIDRSDPATPDGAAGGCDCRAVGRADGLALIGRLL